VMVNMYKDESDCCCGCKMIFGLCDYVAMSQTSYS
jgi:hypothetical protein